MDHKNAIKEESKSTHIKKLKKKVKPFGFWKDRIIWYTQCFVALVKTPRLLPSEFDRNSSCKGHWLSPRHQMKKAFSLPLFFEFLATFDVIDWLLPTSWNTLFPGLYNIPFFWFFLHHAGWSLTPVCWVLLSIEILNVAFPLSSYPGWWLQLLSGC